MVFKCPRAMRTKRDIICPFYVPLCPRHAGKAEIHGGAFEAGSRCIPVVFKCPRAMRTKRDIKGT